MQKYGYFYLGFVFSLFLFSCSTQKETLRKPTRNSTKSTVSRNSKNQIKEKYADKLGVDEGDITDMELYNFLNEWVGTRYKYGGKSKSGIDCSGFANMLYKTVYGRELGCSAEDISQNSKTINKNNVQEGDIVLFKINSTKASHIGIYLKNNKFVHASSKVGVTINDLNEPYYKKYFYKTARVR